MDSDGCARSMSPPTDRVVDVMEMLAVEPDRRFTLAQICRSQRITRATGHAILGALVDRGWVDRDDVETTYAVGGRMGAVFAHERSPGRVLDDLLRTLARDLDMPVSLAMVRNRFLVVTATVAPPSTPGRVAEGLALPVIAPFAREYIAWADGDVRADWLRLLPPGDHALRMRLDRVLGAIRGRGFTVDRLSRPLVRVQAALLALGADVVVDELSAALAATYADLATIDVTDEEMGSGDDIPVATISVPIGSRSVSGGVTMSLGAQPFTRLAPPEIRRIAARLTDAARRAETMLADDAGAVRGSG